MKFNVLHYKIDIIHVLLNYFRLKIYWNEYWIDKSGSTDSTIDATPMVFIIKPSTSTEQAITLVRMVHSIYVLQKVLVSTKVGCQFFYSCRIGQTDLKWYIHSSFILIIRNIKDLVKQQLQTLCTASAKRGLGGESHICCTCCWMKVGNLIGWYILLSSHLQTDIILLCRMYFFSNIIKIWSTIVTVNKYITKHSNNHEWSKIYYVSKSNIFTI